MASTVIVGVDGSDTAAAALRWAHAWGQRIDVAVQPVYVMSEGVRSTISSMVPAEDAWLSAGRAVVERTARMAGVTLPPLGDLEIVACGDTDEQLTALANDAVALVLGSRGLGSLSGILASSVTAHIVRHGPSAVIVVPTDAEPPSGDVLRTMVAVDGSDNSVHALRFAASVTREGDPLTAVNFWQYPPVELLENAATHAGVDDDASGPALELLATAIGVADLGDERPVIPLVRRDDPRHGLGAVAEEVDLLVMGQRGRSTLTRVTFGSVASHIVHHLAVPTAFVADR